MASKIKSRYKNQVFMLVSAIFLLMLFSADSPLDLGHDLSSIMTFKSIDFFQLFKDIYYVPNMVIPLMSGFIIDYIGLTYVLLAISCFGIIGQLYMFLYMLHSCMSFEYLFVGRVLCCISCETICVSVFSYVAGWFQGLQVGEYVGLLVGLNGIESLVFTALSAHLFENHDSAEMVNPNTIRNRYQWLFGANLVMSVMIVGLSLYLFKVGKIVEQHENKIPVLKQHPDKLLGFWKSLKKSLRQNFLLICLVFSFMYCSFQALHSNIHQILTLALWGNQPYCNTNAVAPLKEYYKKIHLFSVVLTMASDFIIMLLPFFVGRYLIMKKRRYLATLFGGVVMFFAMGIVLGILKMNCADPNVKIIFFIVALLLCDLSYSLQYGLLYASVALMTKQNFLGTRFGIIHAIKNFFYFFFMYFEGTNIEITAFMSNEDINNALESYSSVFRKTALLVVLQILLYALIIYRMDVRHTTKEEEGINSTYLEEMSTFIKSNNKEKSDSNTEEN